MGLSRRELSALRDTVRTQLWLPPAAGVCVAVLLGLQLPRMDPRIVNGLPPSVRAFLFSGGADAARSVLDAIASSLITVTSLTFSLTVVTLQLASGQFSPRLLRTFSRDRFVQSTLALFLSTFAFSLTVLRTIRTADEGGPGFVPHLSVTVAFVLAVASMLSLVMFLAHLAREVRVETMLLKVHADANDTVRRVLPRRERQEPVVTMLSIPPRDAVPLTAGSSGFLVRLDEAALLSAAVKADAVLFIDVCAGDLLVAGTPFGVCWRRAGGAFDPGDHAGLVRRVAGAARTAFERTTAHDVGYGVRQLTDVVTKALSPGINDPTTAVHALGHLTVLLCELAGRRLGPRLLCDDEGRPRVLLRRPGLADLLEMATAQPERYGAADPDVMAQLMHLLRDLAWCAPSAELPMISERLSRLRARAAAERYEPAQRARLIAAAIQAEQALAGHWTSTVR